MAKKTTDTSDVSSQPTDGVNTVDGVAAELANPTSLSGSTGASAATAPAKASPVTNAYAFHQAVKWLNDVVKNAADLDSLKAYLSDLQDNTQTLVDRIDEAERATMGRIASGTPRVGQKGAA